MRLLLDEMFSPLMAAQLRSRGHDVESIKGTGHERLSDSDVLDLARSQGRAIVTEDRKDFRPLYRAAVVPGGPGHLGMVFMTGNYRRSKADTGRIINALEAKLARFPGDHDLANGETWL